MVDLKHVIVKPFGGITDRVTSHGAAPAFIYQDQIKRKFGNCDVRTSMEIDINKYDVVWVFHGREWGGSLNLFGGVSGFGGLDYIVSLSKFKGQVISLDIDFPDYHTHIKNRLDSVKPEKKDTILPEWHDIDLESLENMHKTAATSVHPNPSDKLVIGDSHSICMYREGWNVRDIPFKTLFGACKQKLFTLVPDNINIVEFYFGNIDIRHHLCRQKDVKLATISLTKEYFKQAKEIANNGKQAFIYELLPIENESRKLPKSGYYKNTPFYGTWEERNNARIIFNETLKSLCETENNVSFKEWSKHLTNNKGELSFDHMEKPQSVHLARSSYPYWTGINVEKGPSLDGLLF